MRPCPSWTSFEGSGPLLEMCVASKTHAARYAWNSIAAQHVLAYQDALRSSDRKSLFMQPQQHEADTAKILAFWRKPL